MVLFSDDLAIIQDSVKSMNVQFKLFVLTLEANKMLMNSFFGSVFIQQLRFASRRAFKGENRLSLWPKNNSNEFNRNTQKANKNDNRLNVTSEKNFIFGGKSQYLANDWQNGDPEKLLEVDKDLELYSRSKKLYREKIIEEDERKRKSIKLGIIKKKMDKLNGTREANFNLLTWDAKEQIKYLHINEPGIILLDERVTCY